MGTTWKNNPRSEEQRKVKFEALRGEIARGLASGPAEAWDVEELIAEA